MKSIRMPYQEKTLNTPAARIKQARIAKNMLIKELSEITGISTTSISKLEIRWATPSLHSLKLLSQTLDVPISYLGCFEHLPQKTLGQRIKKARLYHGMTKEEFAQVIGVDVKTLRNWETGLYKPLPQHLDNLSLHLKILSDE